MFRPLVPNKKTSHLRGFFICMSGSAIPRVPFDQLRLSNWNEWPQRRSPQGAYSPTAVTISPTSGSTTAPLRLVHSNQQRPRSKLRPHTKTSLRRQPNSQIKPHKRYHRCRDAKTTNSSTKLLIISPFLD